jgi:hypothetical protein
VKREENKKEGGRKARKAWKAWKTRKVRKTPWVRGGCGCVLVVCVCGVRGGGGGGVAVAARTHHPSKVCGVGGADEVIVCCGDERDNNFRESDFTKGETKT